VFCATGCSQLHLFFIPRNFKLFGTDSCHPLRQTRAPAIAQNTQRVLSVCAPLRCPETRASFCSCVGTILAADSWAQFFDAVGLPAPPPDAMWHKLLQSRAASKRKKYHTGGTDFDAIHSHGTSRLAPP
jgi:hypothetical protein